MRSMKNNICLGILKFCILNISGKLTIKFTSKQQSCQHELLNTASKLYNIMVLEYRLFQGIWLSITSQQKHGSESNFRKNNFEHNCVNDLSLPFLIQHIRQGFILSR